MQLDLLDFGLRASWISGTLFDQLCSAGTNTSVGVVDVVEEDFLGVVARCRDPDCCQTRSCTRRQRRSPFEEEAHSVFA